MATRPVVPPPPPGFELERAAPPPPPGFELVAAREAVPSVPPPPPGFEPEAAAPVSPAAPGLPAASTSALPGSPSAVPSTDPALAPASPEIPADRAGSEPTRDTAALVQALEATLDRVSPETGALDFLAAVGRLAGPTGVDLILNAPRRPDLLLAQLRQRLAGAREGRPGPQFHLRDDELTELLRALERGEVTLPDDETADALAALLTPGGRQALRQAVLTGEIVRRRRESQPGAAGMAALEGAVRGVTFNTVPTEDPQAFLASLDPEARALLEAAGRARRIRSEQLVEEHPVASFAGEAAGSVLPFAAGVRLLRAARVGRGLPAVEPGTGGMVAEGAKVGGPQAFLYRPEGAEEMTAGEELRARAAQAGIGVAAGALLDFGAAKLGEFVGRYARLLRDRRFEAQLRREAERAGFDDVDTYISALTEIEQTPDGPIIRPRREVLERLPGAEPETAAAPEPTAPEAAPPAPAERQEPSVDFAGGRALPPPPEGFEVVPPTRAHETAPTEPPPPAPEPAPEPPPAQRAASSRRQAEYERLARLTDDPEIRAELELRAQRERERLRAALSPEDLALERQARARARAQARLQLRPSRDDLLTAIRKLGGIDTDIETDWRGRLSHLPRVVGLPALERPGRGRSLDDLAEALAEHGYLTRRDVGELYNLLDRAAAGERIYSFHVDPELVEGAEPPRARSTDRDWVWMDPDEALATRGDVILTDDGAIVPARQMTLEDWLELEREMRNAEEWFEREAADAGGVGADRPPQWLDDPAQGRVVEPARGETAELPGLEPRSATRQAIADRQREIDARLRGTEYVPPGMGEGDLFSGRARQMDIADVPGARRRDNDFRAEEPTGRRAPPGRGGNAGPQPGEEIELLFAPAARETERLAALERIGPRVRHVQTGTLPSGLTRVRTAREVAHAVAALRREAQENFLAVVTDEEGNVLRVARVGLGGRADVALDPGLIAATVANTPGGRRVWFVHNHPSGHVDQSAADHAVTRRLHDILLGSGIDPQGMVVVAPGGRYTFFRPGEARSRLDPEQDITGEVGAEIPAGRRTELLPITERRLTGRATGPEIRTHHEAAAALRPYGEGILLLNNRSQPVGFLPMSADEMAQLRRGAGGPSARLLAAIDEVNASSMIARVMRPMDSIDFARAAGNLDGFTRQTNLRLLDVFDENLAPARTEGRIPEQSTFYANPFVLAAAELARDVGLHPGRHLAAGFAGGTLGAIESEHEPGSAGWWLDVARGAGAGMTLAFAARRLRLLGKGSIVDNWRARIGDWIESLPLIGRGPGDLKELKRKQRLMQEYIDRQTAEIGRQLLERFTPSERAMMADLIERRGIVKDLNAIHRQAQALDDYLAYVARRMKELKMLPSELEEGGYLHRYYAKHIGLDKLFREAKGQSLSGSYSIARGTTDTFGREYFSPGARAIVDEFERVMEEIRRLEKIGEDFLSEDNAARLAALRQRRRELQKVELREFVGHQNGRLRSFLFAADEVGRVETGTAAPTGVPFVRSGVRVLADRPRAPEGAIDPRAMPVAPGVDDLRPTDRVWTVRGAKGNQVLLHRDWTKAERQAWGEIDDAGYRYVRGMMEASHDLSLATFFDAIAKRPDWVSDTPRTTRSGKEWVRVPDTRVGRNSPLKTYGALAGKYVRPDVWNGIKGYGRNPLSGGPVIPGTGARLGDVYLSALNRWKIWKTVYNPVTHLNNTWSNLEMLWMAGYRTRDLAEAIRLLLEGENSKVWREARDAGLFGKDWATATLYADAGRTKALMELAEALRTQPEIPDASLSTMMRVKEWWINSRNALAEADSAWQTGAALARAATQPAAAALRFITKPVKAIARAMQRAYKWEDDLFKLAVFQAERRRGASVDEAVRAAEYYFFNYSDLPRGIRLARDLPLGSPFLSYTYLAVQAIARAAAQNPERLLALLAAYEAFNYAALVAEGMSPGEYWQIESAEELTSPPWERGRALWGARNMVRIPMLESYRLALGRAHALGNPFMDSAGGREKLPAPPYVSNFWGSSIFGGNPLHALLDVAVNEDWKGKEIYRPGAPAEEKARKIAAYLYQAWTPSNVLVPGGYHQARVLEGLANEARRRREAGEAGGIIAPIVDAANGVSEALGFGQFTGLDRSGEEILTRDALLASFGIKLQPIRTELAVEIATGQLERQKRQVAEWFQEKVRLHAEGRLTDAQLDAAERAFDEAMERLATEQDEQFDAEEFLRKRFPGPSR